LYVDILGETEIVPPVDWLKVMEYIIAVKEAEMVISLETLKEVGFVDPVRLPPHDVKV
jgi:hypothetical protein